MNFKIAMLLALLILVFLNFFHPLYLNLVSHSLPFGIYQKIDGVPQRGQYAATCLTEEIVRYGLERHYLAPGICSTGTVPVLKIIKGLPGDYFIEENGRLRINGRSYPMLDKDSNGRPLKVFYLKREGILGKGQYMLLSDFVPNSWDSRYFGAVPIQFLLKPLWIFENVKK